MGSGSELTPVLFIASVLSTPSPHILRSSVLYQVVYIHHRELIASCSLSAELKWERWASSNGNRIWLPGSSYSAIKIYSFLFSMGNNSRFLSELAVFVARDFILARGLKENLLWCWCVSIRIHMNCKDKQIELQKPGWHQNILPKLPGERLFWNLKMVGNSATLVSDDGWQIESQKLCGSLMCFLKYFKLTDNLKKSCPWDRNWALHFGTVLTTPQYSTLAL